MFAIIKKEIQSFFASPIGYLVIAVYLIANGLFLWVFKSEFNIFNSGFSDLNGYYFLAPWIFLFLIPAITMKSFSEEQKQGTLELLLTKPVSLNTLVLGKFFGSFILMLIALIPSILYVITIYELGNPKGNIDLGSTAGAYIGLIGIALVYTAIGIFTSTLTNNQIVAFISAAVMAFVMYFGFELFAELDVLGTSGVFIEQLGLKSHFNSISRGVIDTRDLIYFVSVAALFLYVSKLTLTQKKP